MERIVIINESTFMKWMEGVKELLCVLHLQEQQMKNKSLGTWLDTSEVCAMLNLSKRSVQSMRERGELPYMAGYPYLMPTASAAQREGNYNKVLFGRFATPKQKNK